MALLPLVSSPFHAKFMGPYTVTKQLSDQNYLSLAYHGRESSGQGPIAEFAHPVCVVNTATIKDAFCEDGLPNHDSALSA